MSTSTTEESKYGTYTKLIERQQILSDEDKQYLAKVLTNLEQAKEQRNQSYVEFGNRTYLQRYYANRMKSISVLPAKKNAEDVNFTAGTPEEKLNAVLSSLNRLDLRPKVRAFDKNDNPIAEAAVVMEDSIFKTQELDGDDEKKLLRQKEMFIQGEVFVEETWEERWKKEKELKGKFSGKFKDVEWTEKLKKVEELCTRNVLHGPDVFLGDITQYYMRNQPFIFKVKIDGYSNAKAIFGHWENFQYVKECAGPTDISGVDAEGLNGNYFTVTQLRKNQVEIIVYQDRANNEFNILINGVMMLPAGFPLSAVSPRGEYTIEKQIFKNVAINWAYGKGFIEGAERMSDILDELLKLAVLKTRKSFMPPYLNVSRKYISPRVLHAGKITMGINEGALVPIGDTSDGVTPSEFQMIQNMQSQIDKQTVSAQFTGQQGKAGTTATEVLELKKQAEMTLGLMVFAASLLEQKIGYQRMWNIMENWYKPIGKEVIGDKAVNKYRSISREMSIPEEGMGERKTIFMDEELPEPEEVRNMELKKSKEYGFPIQLMFINPEDMKNAIKKWYIVVTPTEKDTSELNKVMFREQLVDIATMTQFGVVPNPEDIQEDYARIYGKDKSKAFVKNNATGGAAEQLAAMGGDPNAAAGGRPNVAGIPNLNNVKQ